MSSLMPANPAVPGEPLLITAEEFAELMQLSVRTLWRLRSGGQIPEPLRIGGAVRWRRDSVIEWIAGGCRPPQSRENDSRRK